MDNEILEKVADSEDTCFVSVVNGFMKKVCPDKENSSMHFKCLNSNETYEFQIADRTRNRFKFSHLCESDPLSYQVCGFVSGVVTNKDDTACGWRVCPDSETYLVRDYPCDGSPVPIGCDGKCDTPTCVDERFCNDYEYGLSCQSSTAGSFIDLPIEKICDGHPDCLDQKDENNCEVESSNILQSCPHIDDDSKTVPIHSYTRCAIFDVSRNPPIRPYCANLHDQTNCSDPSRVGGQCLVDGFLTNISKSSICSGYDLCDDGSHNLCIDVSIYCQNIHKHKFCDGIVDCLDGSDETNDECKYLTDNVECTRMFGNQNTGAIPRSWIQDGVIDCLDGIDEIVRLDFCEIKGNDIRYVKDGACENVFLCPKADSTEKSDFVKFDLLCDSKESCNGTENEICTMSRDIPPKSTIVPLAEKTEGFVKDLCNQTDSKCTIREFAYPVFEVFGVERIKLNLNISSQVVDCRYKFGEHYVYHCCMGLCENSSCPLKNEPLKHDACPQQYNDRVLTLANTSHLTFATKTTGRGYHNDIFQCDNGRCLNYSQVCDLVNDCGDMSDELNCNNHFKCESSLGSHGNEGNEGWVMQLIGYEQKCDGIYDCLDLSDECNAECTRRIINTESSLTPFCWVIGILSTLLNICALSIVPVALRRCRNENVLFSKSLVILIFIGDLLMGIYLIALSVYDDIVYKEDLGFCKKQAEWFTGVECKVLGIISTIGSQLSLFAMTALSIFRLFKVMSNGLPLPVRQMSVVKSLICSTLIIILSVAIAVIPLIPSKVLDDYFVQGMYYDTDYQLFVGLNSKRKHVNILEKYYRNITDFTVEMSWDNISTLVDGMFSNVESFGILGRRQVHFYGNDGLCMFKYIIPKNDARRGRQGTSATELDNDPVVWAMLTINLICFVVILVSAIVICQKSRKSTSGAGQTTNKVARKRNRNLELRILAIVVTDFLCWVPFIIICYLHNQGKVDATSWYQTLALVVLPINSLINPMIYDRTITQYCRRRIINLTTTMPANPINSDLSPTVVHENFAATSREETSGSAGKMEMQFLKEL